VTEPYYSDDAMTLYHGDCREVTEWLAADVLVTDPPYGVAWTSGVSSYRKWRRINHQTAPIINDESSAARDAILEAWGERPALVFGSWRIPRPEHTKHRLVWHKLGMFPGPINAAFVAQDEEIYVLGNGWRKTSPPLRSVLSTTEVRHQQSRETGHPTPKPVGLMCTLIDRCIASWVIADPFAGSGSTLVAAKALSRHAIGVEIEERYCEIAARRLSQGVLEVTA
jgi:site-specific DNA-methyltransferase (adenine-specific)